MIFAICSLEEPFVTWPRTLAMVSVRLPERADSARFLIHSMSPMDFLPR